MITFLFDRIQKYSMVLGCIIAVLFSIKIIHLSKCFLIILMDDLNKN